MAHGHKHDKYTKEVISSDQQKHKIVTLIERHPTIHEVKFIHIMKQISLTEDNIKDAFKCPYTKKMYERDLGTRTKDELRQYSKH